MEDRIELALSRDTDLAHVAEQSMGSRFCLQQSNGLDDSLYIMQEFRIY